MNKKFEVKIKETLKKEGSIDISSSNLEKTIKLTQIAYENRKKRKPMNFLDLLERQVKYIGIKIWLFQGTVLFFLLLLIKTLKNDFSNTDFLVLFSFAGIFIAMTVLPFLRRSFKYKMYELEMSTYISLPKLMLCKFILIAIGDLIAIFVLTISVIEDMNALNVFICIFLPFLLACYGCLFILNHIRESHSFSISVAFCALLMLFIQRLSVQDFHMSNDLILTISIALIIVSSVLIIVESRKYISKLASVEYAIS